MTDGSKRSHWSETEKMDIRQRLQTRILRAMADKLAWDGKEIAFQGGSALRFGHRSPRHSEDLDFLVRDDLPGERLINIMRKVRQEVEESFSVEDPTVKLELREKVQRENNALELFEFKYSIDGRLGKAVTKAEFWPTDSQRMKAYKSQVRPLSRPDDPLADRCDFPVASLESILADKLFATTARGRIKYRDLHDIAWILNESQERRDLTEALASREMQEAYVTSAALYAKDRDPDALMTTIHEQHHELTAFLESNLSDHLEAATEELSRYTPGAQPDEKFQLVVKRDLENARSAIKTFSEGLGAALEEVHALRSASARVLSSPEPEPAPPPRRPRP